MDHKIKSFALIEKFLVLSPTFLTDTMRVAQLLMMYLDTLVLIYAR